MTILEALVKLRNDLKLWCTNNFNKKLNKNLGSNENNKFLATDENGEIITASADVIPTSGSSKMVTSDGVFNSRVQSIQFNFSSYEEQESGWSSLNNFGSPVTLPKDKTMSDVFAIELSYMIEGETTLNRSKVWLSGISRGLSSNWGDSYFSVLGIYNLNENTPIIVQGTVGLKFDTEPLIKVSLQSFNMGTGQSTEVIPETLFGTLWFK